MALLCTADDSEHKTPAALRIHLRRWLNENREKGREWAIDYLRQRKADKGLVYAPSQAELRTLYCPTMPYYDAMGGYYAITRELGFVDRYVAETPSFVPLMRDARFICDTREQKALVLPYDTDDHKLEWGDYALAFPHDKGVRIERKGVGDYWGTFNSRKVDHKRIATDSARERFERELIRAQEADGYIVMLVEASVADTETYKSGYGKVGSSHVFKNMRDLLAKYPLTWQVVFADGRTEAASKLVRIFEMGGQVRRVDLQYALEKGSL